MTQTHTPLLLIVLDGWGYRDASQYNAIANANTPIWNKLWSEGAHSLIETSGMAVGLPEGQMGNSEVGHMSLGAGRVVYQNFTRINKAIADGDFFTNPVYVKAVEKAVANDRAVHIMGLLSPGGVHSHEDHIHAAIKLAAQNGAKKIYLHAFLDGRDTPPRSAEPSLRKAEELFAKLGTGGIGSVCGRFFALDRDSRWERLQPVYEMLTEGKTEFRSESGVTALQEAYQRGEDDEFVKPTLIDDKAIIKDGDTVLFMNFRPDRARQIARTFVDDGFDGFPRKVRPVLADFVMTTEYAADIPASCAYPPENLNNTLGEVLSKQGITQLRIAETEKYAHVTFFFSGGQEELFAGEDRKLIPSPRVRTYDLKPEMSAYEVTDKLVAAIESGDYQVIICNYANCDQVGHTGNFDASVAAVEAVDHCLGRVVDALAKTGGECLITADHGNVELMYDEASGQLHTQHTTLPVPLVYVGDRNLSLRKGILADIAPTMLEMLGIEKPQEMSGKSLIA